MPLYLIKVSFKSLNKSGDGTLFVERHLSLISISHGMRWYSQVAPFEIVKI